MEIYVRNTCWNCFGTEPTCEECEGQGYLYKWIQTDELGSELDRWHRTLTWEQDDPLKEFDIQLPLTGFDDFNMPPNINI